MVIRKFWALNQIRIAIGRRPLSKSARLGIINLSLLAPLLLLIRLIICLLI